MCSAAELEHAGAKEALSLAARTGATGIKNAAVPNAGACCAVSPRRRAAEVCKVHGKLSCLMINDLDAGIGHFENTQASWAGV